MDFETAAFAGLLGRCPAMERLRRKIAQFGPTELCIHVFGETGTGKEMVARALHAVSPRARHQLVPVNVAGIADDMLTSELFGHARGAFTGAVAARDGYVAEAEGGTLFIDEVGDMSPQAQKGLLRFLEGGEYRRLGENRLRRADVRVITATNVDLERRVREKRFREDLWFRLQDETIELPPLREREGDVILLARHFLRAQATDRGVVPPTLSREVEAALLGCSWPGNVRQLLREMRRLSVCASGREVTLEDLSPALRHTPPRRAGKLRAVLDEVEAELLQDALDRSGGVVARAAAELGITRQSLWEKVRRRGLVGESGEGCYPRPPSRGGPGWSRKRKGRTGAEVEAA